jgi:hypothetical protein
MMFELLLRTLLAAFLSRQSILLENAALRHQIEVLQRNSTRPTLRWRDRAIWDLLSCIWTDWRKSLFIVQPETVIRWHRQGFRLYWKWLSRPRRSGRPHVSREIRELICQMSAANPLWGTPRIHGELLKLGICVGQATVSKYMVRQLQHGRDSRSSKRFPGKPHHGSCCEIEMGSTVRNSNAGWQFSALRRFSLPPGLPGRMPMSSG